MSKPANFDEYISRAAEFAQPILTHLRNLVHNTLPGVQEEFKWGMPFFSHKGQNICYMAAFKKHCTFGFWLAPAMSDPHGVMERGETSSAMGQFGRISSLASLPAPEILSAYMQEAMLLTESGVKLSRNNTAEKKEVPVPEDFGKLLQSDPLAMEHFERMSVSHRREYLEWINEAKREETRLRRMEKALIQLREGKSKEWKYQR